jgi:hypothetical protein
LKQKQQLIFSKTNQDPDVNPQTLEGNWELFFTDNWGAPPKVSFPEFTSWTKPYRFDVTSIIESGDNNLIVEVANTWSKRLTGDAITGENYTNTNISNTVLPTEGMSSGDQTRVPWADVPLIESGLMGPVKIVSFKKWPYTYRR